MALPILDGNQTTVTLATTVSGGAHYPNHIIASSVTISSLPAVSGTVTANVPNLTDCIEGYDEAINQNVVAVHVKNLNGDVFGYTPFPISGTVTIGSLPVQLSTTTIGGTARLNVTLSSATTIGATAPSYGNLYGGSDGTNLRAILVDSSGRTTVTGSVSVLGTPSVTFSAIAGTVTANLTSVPTHGVTLISTTVTVSSIPSITISSCVTHGVTISNSSVTIGGTVTANAGNFLFDATDLAGQPTGYKYVSAGGVEYNTGLNKILNLDSNGAIQVGSNPSNSLTTRFGSVTTANTAQITTAVTNTSRKYLLIQNNQTGTSAGTVTIGIGFTPTITRGIQLISGASYTADSFIPTGAVYWLGSVTGATFTILEG
jgi:hypothetical protein